MTVLRKTNKAIDYSAETMGVIGWGLILYCMIMGVTDVFLRYVLNTAVHWIGTTVQVAMVLIACAGGIYAYRHDFFVKLDVIYARFSSRKRALCDILTSVYTFSFLGVLIWKGWQAAELSLMLNQKTPTVVPIPVYPIKYLIPVCAAFVLVLVVRQFIRDVRTVIGR